MKQMPKWLPYALVAMVFLLLLVPSLHSPQVEPTVAVSYSEFKSLLASGDIEQVELEGTAVTAQLKQPQAAGPDGQCPCPATDPL